MLFLIGLGLGDENDVTVKGANAIRSCSKVFLEMYTSVLGVDVKKLEATYGKTILIADRGMVESTAEADILTPAQTENVAVLVVGDALCATTHTDLLLRAKQLGIKTEVVHNASIMTAVGVCGVNLYNFGQTVSIPFFTPTWQPDSFYDKVAFNLSGKLHTLCLLDIKVKEPDFEAMTRGRTAFLPPRFMSINTALQQLLIIAETRKDGVITPASLVVGLARVGQSDERVVFGPITELITVDFGAPLHSLVILGELHDMELEYLQKSFAVTADTPRLPPPKDDSSSSSSDTE